MFTRMTNWKTKETDVEAIQSNVERKRAEILAVPELLALNVVWKEDGSGVTIAVYESEAAANAASTQIQAIWGDLASMFSAQPETATYSKAIILK